MDADMTETSRTTARTRVLGLALLAFLLLLAAPASASALLAMQTPVAGSTTGATPTFAGSTEDLTDPVDVLVYAGATAAGEPVRRLEATPPFTSGWSVRVAAAEALPAGTYSGVAEQAELLGLGEPAKTEPIAFTVDTEAPVLTLKGPPALSDETEPSFSGTTSEDGEVVVHVFEGSTEVAKANAVASGGAWSTDELSKALPSGEHAFTAYATERSGLGNPEGRSATVSFEVDTEAPSLTIAGPQSPSNDTLPSFSGTTSEDGEVVVHVFEGSTEVAKTKTTASAGVWTTEGLNKVLPSGDHVFKAYATERSGLGNGEGRSATVSFEVDTEAPTLTIAQPRSPSADTTPSFSGTASEDGEVVVHVFEGSTEVAQTSTTASRGAWSTTALSSPLPSGKHTFTAYASESSGLGNGEGRSTTVAFEIDTEAPVVTLSRPPTPSDQTEPTFSGTASEDTQVVVHVLEGSSEVASVATTAASGSWSVKLSKPLPSGKHSFTAFATEASGIGGSEGRSATVSFEVDTETPALTLNQPVSPSNKTQPSFSGTASEAGEVVVHVFEGSSEVASVTTATSAGSWSTSPLSRALPSGKHTFTAFATEESGLGNGEGKSASVSFEVNTEPPAVTLAQPVSPSNKTQPSFSGSASEATEVTVHVFEGSSEVASATATAAGGAWSTNTLSKLLPSGKHSFTAVATEKSGLGNGEGKSATVSFEVNTEPPKVTLSPPLEVSNDETPSFSGTASEAGSVTVKVFKGAMPEGTLVATLKAEVSGNKWSTAHTEPLPNPQQYTVIATEPSALGNAAGGSAPASFEVNAAAPTIELNALPARSNDRQPSFSGTVSNKPEKIVKVLIYEGKTVGGLVVAEAQGQVTGTGKMSWSTKPLVESEWLKQGQHTYTAVASVKSAEVGNPEGKSAPVTFEVDTEPPTVTLSQPPSLSNQTKPTFTGEASEAGEVTVEVFAGAKAEGTPVTSAKGVAEPDGGGFSWSASLNPGLADGEYTAIAKQESAIGNGEGKSSPVSFTVDTKPPEVALDPPRSPSSNHYPSFSGTASEGTPIAVDVYRGATPSGSPVAAIEAEVAGGEWKTGRLTEALEYGEYVVVARQNSAIGNPAGASAPAKLVLEAIPPAATTEAANEVQRSSAALYASVNPLAGPISACYFEWGTSTAYGHTIECGFVSGASAFQPEAASSVPVFARIFGLHPSTTYHVRIVAVGEGGTADGGDQTFTTEEALSFPEKEAPKTPPPPVSHPPAKAGVASFFAEQLLPGGKAARIGALLKSGLFKQRFKALEAGTEVVKWYYLPPGAKLAKASKRPQPLLVASGSIVFRSAGSAEMKIRLSSLGRALLKRSKRLRLTAVSTFTTAGEPAVTASASFQLAR
jgi:hypothetical protein